MCIGYVGMENKMANLPRLRLKDGTPFILPKMNGDATLNDFPPNDMLPEQLPAYNDYTIAAEQIVSNREDLSKFNLRPGVDLKSAMGYINWWSTSFEASYDLKVATIAWALYSWFLIK